MAVDDDTVDTASPAWTLLAQALEPSPPPPRLRKALLETLGGSARYLPFVPATSKVFDLDAAAARALLMRAADRSQWRVGKPPFLAHMDFAGGPGCGGLRAGFVAMEGGTLIPRHRHTDREITLVLEGAIRSDGRTYGPAEVLEMAVGSEHVFEVGPNGAVFAVLRGRLEFLAL
jgi:hypothetical protein